MDYLQYINCAIGIGSEIIKVLNLVINGLPSILIPDDENNKYNEVVVLNLVINGLPSIQKENKFKKKWMTF